MKEIICTVITSSWFIRQGALYDILQDGFWESDHDFLIAFHSNFFIWDAHNPQEYPSNTHNDQIDHGYNVWGSSELCQNQQYFRSEREMFYLRYIVIGLHVIKFAMKSRLV